MRLAYTCVENVAFRSGSSVDASGAGARKTPPRLPSAAGGFGGAGPGRARAPPPPAARRRSARPPTRASHPALQEVRDERPREVGVVRLEALVVGMAKAVIRVGEVVPFHGLTVGEEGLPQRRLDRRRRDEILAAREHERGALERPGHVERMARTVRGLGLVTDRRIVEDDGFQLWMVGREGNQQAAAEAVPDARRARRIRLHGPGEVLPRLVELAEEL